NLGTEVVDFVASTFTDSNFGWLDVWDGVTKDATEAKKLVNYIRGQEQVDYRPRVLDYDGDGTDEVMRLGDIVHSTPTVQAAPAEAFDILALDESYATFRTQYRNRRNVIYVGANDGMIHAFNGGFFDVSGRAFKTQLTSETAHPLGSEIWAYVPKNLLGHLQWLKEEDYSHVFYADLKPLLFDAKIFDADVDHPNGWGTVLVVGMRLGGGHDSNGIVLDTEADGIGGADDVLTKSAYVVLDVTNPEKPPKLIAELSPPGQFFTTSFPAAVVMGEAIPTTDPSPPNNWYLLLGSGPTALGSVESTQNARVFGYDLRELVLGNSGVVESGPFAQGAANDGIGYVDTNDPNTFVGEFTVADQDLDMKAEAVYFGTVGGQSGTGGNFFRMTLAEKEDAADWEAPFKLLAVDKPFSSRASITVDEQFRTWLVVGTGRLYTNTDKESTAVQTLYGFIDPYANPDTAPALIGPLDHTAFEDVTNATTLTNGSVDLDGDGTEDTTYDAFAATVEEAGGWFLNYQFDPSFVGTSERQVANPTLIGGIALATAFTPSTDLCGAEGESRLLGRAFDSGLVPPGGIFGTEACASCPTGVAEAVGTISLGKGLASSPSIHIGNQDVPGKVTVIVQQSTGAITGTEAQTLGGLRNGEISWQEFRSE
ncbi:MAG: PilC/PilY family type IV pilus protein, partial [Gammaproteobacteria bacterium]